MHAVTANAKGSSETEVLRQEHEAHVFLFLKFPVLEELNVEPTGKAEMWLAEPQSQHHKAEHRSVCVGGGRGRGGLKPRDNSLKTITGLLFQRSGNQYKFLPVHIGPDYVLKY